MADRDPGERQVKSEVRPCTAPDPHRMWSNRRPGTMVTTIADDSEVRRWL